MKAKRSTIRRRIASIVGATVSMLLMSGPIAYARQLDEVEITGPFPAAPPVQAEAVGGSNAWIIALIVAAGVLALTAGLIGTVRLYRSRTRTVAAGA
jgi:hypothetical protein